MNDAVAGGEVARTSRRQRDADGQAALICLARDLRCALPIDHVVETMRPLTVETVAATPAFVRGVSVVRGAPVPVVDLGAILGCTGAASPTRFVTLSVQGRTVALAVEGIVGVRFVPRAAAEALPPLLRDASKDVVETIGRLDSALLVVLRAGRIVPEEVWKDLMGTEAPA